MTRHHPDTLTGASLLPGEAQDPAMLELRPTLLAADPPEEWV